MQRHSWFAASPLVLAFALIAACGDEGDHELADNDPSAAQSVEAKTITGPEQNDSGAAATPEADDGLDELVLLADKGTPISAKPPQCTTIDNKLEALSPLTRTAYFAYPTTPYAQSHKDGTYYRYYRGYAGDGVIYAISTGRYVYGHVLQEYARNGYEWGNLGYPTANPVVSGGRITQAFNVVTLAHGVDLDACLAQTSYYIVQPTSDSNAYVTEEKLYYNDSTGLLSTSPQPAAQYQYSPLSPAARDLAGGYLWGVWCGPNNPYAF